MSLDSKNTTDKNTDIDESQPSKKRSNKWGIIVIGTLLVAVGLFMELGEYIAGNVLVSQIENHSKGEYTLDFEKLSINWLDATIKLDNFTYKRTNKASEKDDEIQFTGKESLITLHELVNFYFEKELNVERININSPKFNYIQLTKPTKKSSFSIETGDLYKAVEGFVKSFQVDHLSVNNLHFDYSRKYDTTNLHYVINDLSFSILNFHLDSNAVADNSEFFFTESVSVILKDQSLGLGDGIHEIHFDSLKISTSDNYIELFQLDLQVSDSSKVKLGSENFYNAKLPYAGFKGLDFNLAYQENVLHTDSVLFLDLDINANLNSIKRLKNKKVVIDTTVHNRLTNVLLEVFEKIELDHFFVSDATFTGVYGNNDTSKIENFHLNFDKYVLDSNDLTEDAYYPNFSGLQIRVDQPEFSLPNNGDLIAESLNFSTYDSSLIIDNVLLNTISLQNKKPTEIKISQVKLEGVKPRQIIENGEIILDRLIIKQPDLKIIIDDNQKESKGFDLSSVLTPESSLIQIKKIEIVEGKAQLITPQNTKSPHHIEQFDIVLNQFKLDQFMLKKSNFLYSKSVSVDLKGTKVYIKKLQHYVRFESVSLNSYNNTVRTKHVSIYPSVSDSSTLKSVVKLKADELLLVGIDFNHLSDIQKIDLKQLKLHGVSALVNILRDDNVATKNASSSSSFISKLERVDLSKVDITDVSLILQNHGVSVAKFSDAYVFANHLSATPDTTKKGAFVLSDDSLSYGLERFMAPIIQNNHMLSFQKCDRGADSLLTIEGFSVRPMPGKIKSDSLLKLTAYTSEIKITNFQAIEHATSDSLNIGLIELNKPMIRLSLPIKKADTSQSFKLLPNLQDSFLDNKFSSIVLNGLLIKDGNISVKKKNVNVAVRKFNLSSSGWSISKNSTWSKDKFLYAQDFSFSMESLEYQLPGLNVCHFIDRIDYSFKPNELTISGIYYNNYDISKSQQKVEVSLYLPYLKVVAPNVYGFVQNNELEVSGIEVSGGKVEADIYTEIKSSGTKKGFNFPTSIPDSLFGLKKIAIHQLDMNKMDFQLWTHKNNNVSPLEMSYFDFKIDSFQIEPGQSVDSNKLFWSDNIELSVKNVYTTLDQGLYELGADEFKFSTKDDTLGLTGVSFIPTVSRYEYALHKGHRVDVFNVHTKQVGVKGIDFFDLIYNKQVKGNLINVEKPLLSILKDKRIPEPPYKRKEILPQLFKQIPIPITFDSILVEEMKVRYEEFPEHGRSPGDIMLSDMNIIATNVSNDTSVLVQDSTLSIFMNSKFLDTADLSLYLEYNMLSPRNDFKMSTELGPFDGTLVNGFIVPTVEAKINSLSVDKMDMSVIGNDSIAGGRMGFYYHDLNFTFLNQETLEAKGFGTKLKSMIGNVVVNSKNKYHPFKRRSPLFFERITGKGWINYLVKIELVGLAGSAGIKQYKKDLKKANKSVWKAFDKEYKENRKKKAKADKKLAKQQQKKNKK